MISGTQFSSNAIGPNCLADLIVFEEIHRLILYLDTF